MAISTRKDDYDPEEMMFRDVVNQMIKEKTSTAYVYNENIVKRLEESMPNLDIKKKDFYWMVKRKDINKKPITIKKVCEELDITRPTLDKWIKIGCPMHVVAGRRYFIVEEIEEWIKSK